MGTDNIACNFVENSTAGDELVLNARLLREFASSPGAFNKLIVMTVGAMVSTGLSQIILRTRNAIQERVPIVAEADQAAVAQRDKFNAIIEVMEKYDILNGLGPAIYGELKVFQDHWMRVSENDPSALTDAVRNWVLDLNKRILSHLSDRFARPTDLRQYCGTLTIPVSEAGPIARP